eukprot:7974964-Pyramimonas_sp.AAC.2
MLFSPCDWLPHQEHAHFRIGSPRAGAADTPSRAPSPARCDVTRCDAMRCHVMPCHAMPCHAMGWDGM